MEPIRFAKWGGAEGIEQYIKDQTGCKPYSGSGINTRIDKKTSILKSVDNTEYYADDMSDINEPTYTLSGQQGDQSEHEKRFNEPLLNKNKTEHIYLYRVKKNGRQTEYFWYGKYEIVGKEHKLHPGKDKNIRTIIILSLKRL